MSLHMACCCGDQTQTQALTCPFPFQMLAAGPGTSYNATWNGLIGAKQAGFTINGQTPIVALQPSGTMSLTFSTQTFGQCILTSGGSGQPIWKVSVGSQISTEQPASSHSFPPGSFGSVWPLPANHPNFIPQLPPGTPPFTSSTYAAQYCGILTCLQVGGLAWWQLEFLYAADMFTPSSVHFSCTHRSVYRRPRFEAEILPGSGAYGLVGHNCAVGGGILPTSGCDVCVPPSQMFVSGPF